MTKELDNIGKTWGEDEKIAKNRFQWRAIVGALCLTRIKESSKSSSRITT